MESIEQIERMQVACFAAVGLEIYAGMVLEACYAKFGSEKARTAEGLFMMRKKR